MKNLLRITVLALGALFYSHSSIAQCGATSVTATPQPVLICEGNAGLVSFAATGTCAGTYQYQVLLGATVVQAWSGTASFSASPTITTSYTVQLRCSSCPAIVVTSPFTIDVVEEPTISGSLLVCPSTSTTLTASGSTGVFEWWNAPVPGTQLSPNGVYTTPALVADQTYYVHVTGSIAGGGGSILITECGLEGAVGGTGSEDYIEISNLYTTPVNTTGWVVAVSSSYTVINSYNTTFWNLPTSFPPCSMQARTDNSGSANYWGNNIFWNPGSSSWAIVIDNLGNVVDFVAWGWTAAQLATFNPTINGFPITLGAQWTGNGCPAACGTVAGVQYSLARTGSADNNNAGDFICQATSVNLLNPGMSCGWTSGLTCPFPVTVEVDMPPTGSSPAPINVECFANIPAPDPAVVTTEADDYTAVPTVTFIGDVSDGLSCPETITRTYRITDGCMSYIDVTQTIIVDDVTAPVLAAAPGPISVQCPGDVPPMISLGYTDNCDPASTILGTDGPLIGGNCGGTITRTWTIADACGNMATVSQLITVDDNTNPTASNLPPINAPGGALPPPDITEVFDEMDNCTAAPIVTLFSEVSDNGVCPETVTRVYRVTDNCGNYIDLTQIITVGDAIYPTASNPLPINVECAIDVPLPDPLAVTTEADNGGIPTVTFEDDLSDGLSCPETIARRYRVTDDCGNYIFVTQTITIQDVTAPVMAASPGPVSVQCAGDVPPMTSLTYTDNCDPGSTVLGIDGPLVGGNCGGTITRTWTATDLCGNTSTETQILTINDATLPTASDPAMVIVPGGPAPAPNVNVVIDEMDNCSVPVVALVSNTTDGGVCPETVTHMYSVTDACGNSINVTHIILITDPMLPTADPLPPVSYNCIGDVPVADPAVVQNEADNNGVPVVTWVSSYGCLLEFD
jgi:hypothetical protein